MVGEITSQNKYFPGTIPSMIVIWGVQGPCREKRWSTYHCKDEGVDAHGYHVEKELDEHGRPHYALQLAHSSEILEVFQLSCKYKRHGYYVAFH